MNLTRKDLYATLAVAAGIVLATSVIEGWSWPLMNGLRMGIIAVGVTGMIACAVSGWADGKPSFGDPFMIVGALLGVVALVAGVIGLFAGTAVWLEVVMAAVVLAWLVTVVDRMLGGGTAPRHTAAG